jgi:transposase
VGYKFHVTETCGDDAPNLIIHVETRPGTEHDINTVDAIHQALDRQNRLPNDHLVDASYVSADELVFSETTYGVNLVGPVAPDRSWQARLPDGLDSAHFAIDWNQQQATCPQGHVSCSWIPQQRIDGYATIKIKSAGGLCRLSPAPCAALVIRPKGARHCTPQPYLILQAARAPTNPGVRHVIRAGEGSISRRLHSGQVAHAIAAW